MCTIIMVNINSSRMKSQILAVFSDFVKILKQFSCLQNYDKKITLLNFYHIWKPRISDWNFMMKPIDCIYQWVQRKVIFMKSITKTWQNNDRFTIVSQTRRKKIFSLLMRISPNTKTVLASKIIYHFYN